MTLLELMLALIILAICALASERMLAASLQTDKYLQQNSAAVSQIEMATRRITHNVRTCQSLSSPTGTTPQTSLSLVTQPDSANGNQSYTVSYALNGTNLQETDTRYGTNTIATNISAFTVTLVSTTSPILVQVSITMNVQPSISRTFRIYCRNL
jgi:type II secretory pathway pseudopilin PulG